MSRPLPRLLALLPVVTASLLVGCGAEPRTKELSAPRPSLVLITLDTTRADRIGAYGHSLARTPTIDGLAAQGARFDRAYAVVPLTTPSHASMLSGVYPTRHGVHNNGDAVLPDRFVTLAERLQAQGWRTGASLSATWTGEAGVTAGAFRPSRAPPVPAQEWQAAHWSRYSSAPRLTSTASTSTSSRPTT